MFHVTSLDDGLDHNIDERNRGVRVGNVHVGAAVDVNLAQAAAVLRRGGVVGGGADDGAGEAVVGLVPRGVVGREVGREAEALYRYSGAI